MRAKESSTYGKDYRRLLNRHFRFGRTLLKDIVRLEISEKLDKLTKTPAEQNFGLAR